MKSEIALAAATAQAQNMPARPNYGCQVRLYSVVAVPTSSGIWNELTPGIYIYFAIAVGLKLKARKEEKGKD